MMCAAHPGSASGTASKSLKKQSHPVRFAPIWPTSVHYADRSRHAALSRAQRPRSTALGCHAARRTTDAGPAAPLLPAPRRPDAA